MTPSLPLTGTEPADESFLADLDRDRPGHPGILARLALVRLRLGQPDAALSTARQAVAAGPRDGGAHGALGLVCRALKRMDEARSCLEEAVRLNPQDAQALTALGETLAQTSATQAQAVEILRRAAVLLPRDPRPRGLLALVFMGMGRHDEALQAYRAAIAVGGDPNTGDLLNNMGVALERLGRRDEAVAVLRSAAVVRPDSHAVHDNLGNSLLSVGDAAGAELCHRRALELGASSADTWSNLGNAMHRQGRLAEAEAAYRRAVDLAPQNPKFHTNLALNSLLMGKFEEGWREYEWRWRDHPGFPAHLKGKSWHGEPLPPDLPAGGTLLLQAEQGFGDTIQFIRYVPWLKRRGVSRVVLACQPELLRLMEGVPGLDQVVSELGPPPPFDRGVTLMSLAGLFRAGIDPIPAEFPYLAVPKGAAVRLPPSGDRLKVGVAWAGRPTHGDDWNRSIPAHLLTPLLEIPGAAFHSLQRGAVAERIGRPSPGAVFDAGDQCADFADTAAVLGAMDLIVSVDTAVIHLAGALGKPVILLLPPVPDFRWLMTGETTAWYPGMTLLRKDAGQGWEPVIARACVLMRRYVESRTSP